MLEQILQRHKTQMRTEFAKDFAVEGAQRQTFHSWMCIASEGNPGVESNEVGVR